MALSSIRSVFEHVRTYTSRLCLVSCLLLVFFTIDWLYVLRTPSLLVYSQLAIADLLGAFCVGRYILGSLSVLHYLSNVSVLIAGGAVYRHAFSNNSTISDL
jgi:hypothetical protein